MTLNRYVFATFSLPRELLFHSVLEKNFCGNTFFISQGMNEFMSEEEKLHQCQVFKSDYKE